MGRHRRPRYWSIQLNIRDEPLKGDTYMPCETIVAILKTQDLPAGLTVRGVEAIKKHEPIRNNDRRPERGPGKKTHTSRED